MVSKGEREDFERCIVEASLSVDDFELTPHRIQPPTKDMPVWTGTVTVTYKPTETSTIYAISSWPAEFEHDLKLNVFHTR